MPSALSVAMTAVGVNVSRLKIESMWNSRVSSKRTLEPSALPELLGRKSVRFWKIMAVAVKVAVQAWPVTTVRSLATRKITATKRTLKANPTTIAFQFVDDFFRLRLPPARFQASQDSADA